MADDAATVVEDGVKRSQVAGVQRSRIIAATFEACAEGGARLSVADIVGRAGISRRTFYELFENCEDCLLVALDQAIALAAERVLAVDEPRAPWRARVRLWLSALLSFLEEQPKMARLLVVDSLAAGPRALERRSRAIEQIVAAMDRCREPTKRGAESLPLATEGILGGVLAILHRQMLEDKKQPLITLLNPLMSMVVLPYMGAGAARAELERPTPEPEPLPRQVRGPELLARLDMRLTYRTIRVLQAIAKQPDVSNRQVGRVAGIDDPGQISKLLARLHKLGLIENTIPRAKGGPNAWTLTVRGAEVQRAIAAQV